MPDFTMCKNKKCPAQDECRRYTATPSPWQSYAHFTVPFGKKKCASFIQSK